MIDEERVPNAPGGMIISQSARFGFQGHDPVPPWAIRKLGETPARPIDYGECWFFGTHKGCMMGSFNRQAMEAVIEDAIERKQIVGAVVHVLLRGELVYRHAAGYADRESARMMTDGTLHRIDSVTKAFTSVAAMRLVSSNLLHPDDLVATWLPEFQPRLSNGDVADLRVRHLMTHTAGLGYRAEEGDPGPYTRAGVSDGGNLAGISMEENLRRLASVPLLFQPGTEWKYGLNTDVLGEIVGRAHGASLREAIRDLVTAPLGLEDTSFDVAPDQADRLAAQYSDGSPQPERMPEEAGPPRGQPGPVRSLGRVFNPSAYPAGGSGLVSTVHDVVTLLEAVRAVDPRVVTPESVAKLCQNQTGNLECDAGWGYSYGWSVLNDPARGKTPQAEGTWSWAGGLGHRWFVDPVMELTVVSLSNTTYAGCFGPFPDAIRDAAYGVITS